MGVWVHIGLVEQCAFPPAGIPGGKICNLFSVCILACFPIFESLVSLGGLTAVCELAPLNLHFRNLKCSFCTWQISEYFSSPLANRHHALALCVWGTCPHPQTSLVLGTVLWIELKGADVGFGMWDPWGFLEVTELLYTACKAWSALAQQPHVAGCFPWEGEGIGGTENLSDLQWQGKSVKLHTAEVLKSEEVLNPDWRGNSRSIFFFFSSWGVFKKPVFISFLFSVSSWWSNYFHFLFHT